MNFFQESVMTNTEYIHYTHDCIMGFGVTQADRLLTFLSQRQRRHVCYAVEEAKVVIDQEDLVSLQTTFETCCAIISLLRALNIGTDVPQSR